MNEVMKETVFQNNFVKFNNDLFFKYLLSRDTLESSMLRKQLVKLVTNLDCKEMIVKNPQIDQAAVLAKNIVLDICAVDDLGRIINIEMQMKGSSQSESKRFQYYGARLLVEQINQGEEYYDLQPVYQIIFINENDDQLIKSYAFRDYEGKMEKGNLNHRYYVMMKHIDKILREKGIRKLNDLERMCYLFIKNEYTDIIGKEEKDIIRMVIEMYDEFKNNEPMWSLANQLELAKIRERSFKLEYEAKEKEAVAKGIAKGIAQGVEQGIEQGIEEGIKKMLKKRYQKECSQWVKELNEKQLELIYDYIFEETEFEKLKQRIDKVN